jgi:hypothetical protein
VSSDTAHRTANRLALAACLLFVCAGQFLIPLLGYQDDESIFGYAFLNPRAGYIAHLGHTKLPLMLMDYLGTLKSWLYRPVFGLFGTGVWSLREPVLLAGAASLWIFFLLLRRVSGNRAAVIGCGILAADSIYLLTSCFDWGPVALQHLLLLGGMLSLMRFYQHGGSRPLAAGFFLFGLAMWDKALAVWMLGALGVAALVIFPRQIFRVTSFRRLGISVLAFGLGALPLIVFNVNTKGATFRGKGFEFSDFKGKAELLRRTADGTALMGWMMNEDGQDGRPRTPVLPIESGSDWVAALAGHPRENLFPYAFALALLLAPLARGTELRGILFALLALALQWGQMAITKDAGGSVHHAILIWPLPAMVVALSFAAASRRLPRYSLQAAGAALALVMIAGFLQLNQYYRLAWRNGGAKNWTDGIYEVSDRIKTLNPGRVLVVDWGILDSLRILHHGRLPLGVFFDAVPAGAPANMARVKQAAEDPTNIFVAHVRRYEFFEGSNARLIQAASEAGFERQMLAVEQDTFGRPVYEVYRFVKR